MTDTMIMRRMPASWLGRAVVLLCTLFANAALAQGFPNKPITAIWPFPGGGTVDRALRAVATEAGNILGQPVLVESRPGANGMLGINAVKQARGDAHTLSFAHNGMLVSVPLTSASTKIAPGTDYVPVGLVLKTNLILAAHPSVPFRDYNGLLSFARANPGKLDAAVVGTASNSHLAVELLKVASGVAITNVPYRGEGQALPDLLGGTVKMFFMTSTAKPLVDAGKLVGIATTGAERWDIFPALPTMQELGLPGFLVIGWFGVVASPGTPPDAIARLNGALNAALKNPAVRKTLQEFGIDPMGSTAEEMSALIQSDLKRWEPIMRKAGIKQE